MTDTAPDGATPLHADDIATIDGLDDWTYVLETLAAGFACSSFAAATTLAAAIAAEADRADHHPDLDIRYPGNVLVTLQTHAVGQVTMLDVGLARTISALAREAGATTAESVVQQLEIAIDCLDGAAIRPFWETALDYRYVEQADMLVDPRRQGPAIWFQQLDAPRPQRNRIHFDITVPPEEAEARVAAAIAAGGTLVSDARARAFWVLADPEGNEVCVCTWQDRR
ncbi:MAG: VOC family protein [Actinomycetota bacterium]